MTTKHFRTALLLLASLPLWACTTIDPVVTTESGATVQRTPTGDFEIALAISGEGEKEKIKEELSNHAPGLCGSTDYSYEVSSVGAKTWTSYGGGVAMDNVAAVQVLQVTCGASGSIPRILMPSDDAGKRGAELVLYNASSFAYSDVTGTVFVSIDGQPVTKLGKKQVVTLDIAPGSYELELIHIDVGAFDGTGTLDVKPGKNIVKVYATPLSTKFAPLDSLPDEAVPYLGVKPTN